MKYHWMLSFFCLFFLIVGCQQNQPPPTAPAVLGAPTVVATLPAVAATVPPAAEVLSTVAVTADPATPNAAVTLTPIPTLTAELSSESTATLPPSRQIQPLDDGRIIYFYPQDGFSLTLPPNWSIVDYLMIDGEGSEPAGALVGELVESELFLDLFANGGLRFYGVDTSDASLSSVNPATVVVVRDQLDTAAEFDAFLAQTIAEIQQNRDVIQGPTLVDYPVGAGDGKSARLDYTLETQNPMGVALTLKLSQGLAWQNGEVVIVTATWAQENDGVGGPQTDAILNSLTFNR